ncbi:hypothetical protein [Corynebacterium glyciniphilum]|uniref:phage tail tube protein n=1 Tax=Corynebacterium glyciniphilum TaxID=1404244 RepID=UPI002651F612|nr:hypothetical protein [Corynebacterium glyciniphilum]MDN6706377.1 hypothetical protein [Corynebacterium glyciniphilum]
MALGNNKNVVAGMPDVSGGLWVHMDGVIATDNLPGKDDDLKEAGFIPVGFVSEDGVSESQERDTDKKKAWGGSTIKVVQNDFTRTYSFTLVEAANIDVLRLVFGKDNVTTDEDGTIVVSGSKDQLPHLTWVMEVLDDGNKIRQVIPDAQITENGEIQWVHSEVIQFEVTLESFEDEKGKFFYEYITPLNASGENPGSGGSDGDNGSGGDDNENGGAEGE